MTARLLGPSRRLLIADDITVADAEKRWIDPLRSFWPGHGRAPAFERIGMHELCAHAALDREAATRPLAIAEGELADAVLMLVGRGFPASRLYRLIDDLERRRTPAVLVLDGRNEVEMSMFGRGLVSGSGVLVESEDVSPGHIASSLLTLMQRQPAVRRTADELRIAEAGLHRAHRELDRVNAELQEAARLQKAFVQSATPYIAELDVGIVYRPASYVSGDTFDIERLTERHVGVLLADAVGHGVPAGLLTLFISRSLPKVDGHGGTARVVPPSEALARLNSAYCGRGISEARFATAVYGVLDTVDMRMRVSCAGHPAPLVVRSDGAVDRPGEGGPLLGVFPDAEYEEAVIDLAGARGMVLYTDGFETAYESSGRCVDPSAPPEHDEKLRRLVDGPTDRAGLADAVSALERELDAQLGSLHQTDDITAIAIAPRSRPAGGTLGRAAA